MEPAVVEQNIREQLIKHPSSDQMEGKLRELPEVEPGQVSVLVKVDQRLGDHLPVGLPHPAADPQLSPLLLGEVVRLGLALAPGSKEELGQLGVKMGNNVIISKISLFHSIIKLFVRPSTILKYNFQIEIIRIPKNMSTISLYVFEKSRYLFFDFHNQYCWNSSNFWNLVFINFIEDFVIQR